MSIKLHSPFIGTPICSSLDGRKNSKLVHFGRRWRHPERRSFLKCYKKSNWPPNGVWFPQIYGKIVKFLKGDIELRNGLRVNYVKERLSQGKELVKSLNPLWQEGLLLFRCSIFAAVISGVCLLLWYGRAKAKEYVELKLLPSVSSALSEYIERETNFGKVRRISPLSITLESCSFGPHSEEFSCGEAPTIKLRIHPFASLRRGKVVIDAVLSHPTLLVAQKKDFTWLGIPYIEEVGLEKHASTEDGIDNRTRIRRAAREEAGACWARERDDGARRAAETGYIVPNHGSDSTEIYAEASKNGSEESMNEQSHLCGDEGMHWKDHHSMDTGVPYDVKHDDLEKSFGYLARSELKPLSQTALGPTVPKFKKKANGKDLSVSDVTAKRRILEQSAAAASLYFRDIRHEKLAQSPSDTSLGNVNDVIRPATNRSEVIDVISEEDDDYGVSKATTHSTRNLRHDDDWPQLFSFPNQKLENTARSNLFHSSNPQVGDAKMTNDSFHRVGVTGKEDFNKSSRVSGGVDVISRDELVSDESDKKDIQGFESSMNTSTHQGNTESFDQALTNKEPSLEDNNSHSARTQSLRSNSSFFKGNIGEEVSHFVSDPIQKLKNGVDGTLGDVATNIVEVDDISSERIDKTLPVILDSVHFKGGTLMLLGYGDAEPREMENVDGHIKFQNHYSRVHVQLSGNCQMWRSERTMDDGGWLSTDVFVDIIEQKWHANLKINNLFVPLFERILEIPIAWSKGRASGELHICMSSGETFPNLHGQLDITGLCFQILDAPSCFSDMSASLCFRGQRVFLHNANGWFGSAPLEASGDFGIHPDEGEFHLMCQVPCVEVNALMKTFKMKPLLFPLAGFVTAIFNCQGPLDAPIFVGSGMVTRKMGTSAFDTIASSAFEAVVKSKDVGAVAAMDRIPFSYLSANFTFNTDNCIADLYGIRASLVDGGEIRGAGNAWICPEAEVDETALDVNFSGSLSFNKILHRYLPGFLDLLPMTLGELKGETKVSGSLLKPRFDVKWNAPKAEGSFVDARGDVIICHDYIAVNSSSVAFDLYTKVLTYYPEENWLNEDHYDVKTAKAFIVKGLELDLRMRGFEFFSMISSYPFDSPRPVNVKATGRIKFQGQVTKISNVSCQSATDGHDASPRNVDSLDGDVLVSGLKLNQLMLAPQLAGHMSFSRDRIKLDASGRPDESLSLEVVGLLHKTVEESLGKLLSFSLQKGQLKANICYQPTVSANLEIRNLPLDELELASLRGTMQRAEVQLNFQKRRGLGVLSMLRPKFSGVLGEALDVAVRWSGDVITVEKTVLEQSYSRYELQGEYVLPGTRERKSSSEQSGDFFSRAMDGHLGSVISSMGRWRVRLEVPRAEAAEMLPLARLLSRSTDPVVRSRSKDFFMKSLQTVGLSAGNLQELLEVIRLDYTPSDEVIPEDISLPGLSELKGHWHGSLDASGGGNGDTVAEFDFHGDDWEWGVYKTQRVQAIGAYSNDDGLRLEKIFIQKDNATIHADGTLLGPKTNLHFAVLNFPVSLVPMLVQVIESSTTNAIVSLRKFLAPVKGILHMEGDLRGNLLKPECDVQVRLLDGAIGGIDLGRAEVVASLTSGSRFLFNAKFEPIVQNGHVHVQGSIPVTFANNNISKEDEVTNSGRTSWTPGWAKNRGRESNDGDAEKKASRDRNEDGWDIQLAESLKGLNWNLLDAGEVRVDADIKDGGMLLLTALSPHADWLHGNAEITLQVRGTVERPELDGSATFHRASVSSPVLRKPLTNLGGRVLVKSNRLCISSLESRVSRRGKLLLKGNLPLTSAEASPDDKIDLKCEVLEVRAKNILSGQVDTQLQITGSILQPSISGNIKLSQGEAYLPHDKGSGTAPFNRLPSNQTRLPKDTFNRMVAARYVSRFFGAEPVISTSSFLQPLGKQAEVGKQTEQVNKKPQLDLQLINLKLVLGPELKMVYPLILDFAVSGEVELNGIAHPKLIKPRGVLTFENGDVNLVATQFRLKREHLNVAKFEPDNGLDPTLDLALVGSEWQFRIQGRASNWHEKLVVTSTRSVEQDVLSPTEAARVFESQLAESILEGDGQLALKKLATATLATLMPRIEGKGEFGHARWRLVYAPQIPSLLSVDPTVDPLKSLASNLSFGTEVEVQLGKRLQASVVRQMKESEMAMQWTLIYQLTSRLRVLLQSAPSKRLLFEYSTTSQD
ncbi:protein TIC236, chloroplastic [Amaranthus tricolor]|uniref:protein TIC236, chloroplastic n=1 Tax=Amaranthus tricolor TaxID=29722 RepID=UPI002586DD55|nr:protein TIC236, chloroplastic [Amaranthus tricolor]